MIGQRSFCTDCEESGNGRCIRARLEFECECSNGFTGVLCSIPPSPSPTHPPSNDTNSLKISIIMTIIFGIFLVLLIIAFVIFILRKKRQKTSFSIPTDKIITPPLYSISLSRSNSTVSSHIYEDLL